MNRFPRVSCFVLLAVSGQVAPAFAAPPAAADARLPELIREYAADRESVSSYYRLPASDRVFDRRQRLQTGWQERLQALDFGALDQSGKVDYWLLASHLRHALDGLAQERKRVAEIERLIPFRELIDALEAARWEAAPLNERSTAAQLDELARQVKSLRENLDKTPHAKAETTKKPAEAAAAAGEISPALALRAGNATRQLHETLKRWYEFHSGYRPEFDWWMKPPYEKAAKELEDYAKRLREEIAGQKGKDDDPLVGDPIGPEAVAADIRGEFLPYTAEELIAIGQRELAWGETQMRAAARQMGLGDDWKAALAKVKADYVPPGGQAALIEALGREATAFVKQRKLVTVPPLAEETWRLSMISPEGIKTMPYAAYGGQQILVAYARSDMSQDDKLMVMRGNNRHFTRLVTPHELIPGHHLQGFYAARHHAYRELFWTPFYVEGWALYWERRLWDLGWAQTPEDRIGMLFWRMTRAARIIVSLKYHLGQMQPDAMVEFLMTRVGHEKLGATSEVRRFIQASPLYQAGYMIGGLQFYALQRELVGGGRMTEQEFHDAVLMQGTLPIAPLRAALANVPLARETQPTWRFDR